ncbi:hypothetical protein A5819_003524 [Enterococcus sp. 7E2_DIV0204]|nr:MULTISPECIES: hypothetical protein [unclassified Enterococcus]OTN83973.1 hypothetical protein A5819_003523 [Enterococcus sp. 7E2_DIV0204]OTN83974.1 hypothetical protein A5819_003524 [Enterococcus sp. 7E2_DIV0204]OTP46822.1 hypothetical protein A5884_003700 [Enterococcus sp. 7D2_DIV0200]
MKSKEIEKKVLSIILSEVDLLIIFTMNPINKKKLRRVSTIINSFLEESQPNKHDFTFPLYMERIRHNRDLNFILSEPNVWWHFTNDDKLMDQIVSRYHVLYAVFSTLLSEVELK